MHLFLIGACDLYIALSHWDPETPNGDIYLSQYCSVNGTNPLPDQNLAYHQSFSAVFTWGNFSHGLYLWHMCGGNTFKIITTSHTDWHIKIWPYGMYRKYYGTKPLQMVKCLMWEFSQWPACKFYTICVSLPYAILHYNDSMISAMVSQITSLTIVYSTVYSDADQRKHQSSASLAFVWPVNNHNRGLPVLRANWISWSDQSIWYNQRNIDIL